METLTSIFNLAEKDLATARIKALRLTKQLAPFKELNKYRASNNNNEVMLAESLLVEHYNDHYNVIKELINGIDHSAGVKAKIILCQRYWEKTNLKLLQKLETDASTEVRKAARIAAIKKAKKNDQKI